jgi:hypothetical protein
MTAKTETTQLATGATVFLGISNKVYVATSPRSFSRNDITNGGIMHRLKSQQSCLAHRVLSPSNTPTQRKYSFSKRLFFTLGVASFSLLVLGFPSNANAQECSKYISSEGKGRDATLEQPAKDLGNIISDLEPGDVVCIAGGTYLGRGDSGVDLIETPVSIYGGYSPDFSARDPWGAHRTIFTGQHNADNFDTSTRLTIDTSSFATKLMAARGEDTVHTVIVDGIIFDNGPRNYYGDDTESRIIRKGTGSDTPTPESGGLVITTGVTSTIVVQNNVVLNTAPTQGAIALFPGPAAQVTVKNNMAVNNTGAGFHLGTAVAASDAADYPQYDFSNNISIFNEKHDAFGTFGGSGIILESSTSVSIQNSIFAFNDNYGVDNAKRADDVILVNNIIAGNAQADYLEFDTKIDLDDIEDWAELLSDASGNIKIDIPFEISEDWGIRYASRNVIDRNAAEEEVQAVDAWYNDVRSFFGWELVGTDLNVDSAVWLPRMSLDEAIGLAKTYEGSYGVTQP